jgi:hypothetical protein
MSTGALQWWCAHCFDLLRKFVFAKPAGIHSMEDHFPNPEWLEDKKNPSQQRSVPVDGSFVRELRRRRSKLADPDSLPELPETEPKLTRAMVLTLDDLANALNVPGKDVMAEPLREHRVCARFMTAVMYLVRCNTRLITQGFELSLALTVCVSQVERTLWRTELEKTSNLVKFEVLHSNEAMLVIAAATE